MVAQRTFGDAAARLADDQAIIVVTDSVTGEVRACGDLTGYCVAMNPWRGRALIAPVRLAAHQPAPAMFSAPATNTTDSGVAAPSQ